MLSGLAQADLRVGGAGTPALSKGAYVLFLGIFLISRALASALGPLLSWCPVLHVSLFTQFSERLQTSGP